MISGDWASETGALAAYRLANTILIDASESRWALETAKIWHFDAGLGITVKLSEGGRERVGFEMISHEPTKGPPRLESWVSVLGWSFFSILMDELVRADAAQVHVGGRLEQDGRGRARAALGGAGHPKPELVDAGRQVRPEQRRAAGLLPLLG